MSSVTGEAKLAKHTDYREARNRCLHHVFNMDKFNNLSHPNDTWKAAKQLTKLWTTFHSFMERNNCSLSLNINARWIASTNRRFFKNLWIFMLKPAAASNYYKNLNWDVQHCIGYLGRFFEAARTA
jgi:hypothetical protein